MRVDGIADVYQVSSSLWAIDEIGRTTMFIYAGTRKALLLDTGFGLLDLKRLANELCPGRELIAANTHAHGDHISGNGQFEEVLVGWQDAPAAAAGLSERETEQFREHFIACSPYLSAEQMASWQPGTAKKVHPLHDGDILELGGIRLEVLETPSHTRGSICLLDRENGVLFTGDIMLTWCVWGHLPESAALHEYGQSIHRLALLGDTVRMICPAHGKQDNPLGWKLWQLEPSIIRVYDRGIQDILDGRIAGKPYSCFLGDGKIAAFPIGGITYRDNNL